MITPAERNELKELEQSLYSNYQKELRNTRYRFLIKINKVKKGDIVEDHSGKIIVESHHLYNSSDSCLAFNGVFLNKNGKPNKKGETRTVYGLNIRNHYPNETNR